MSSRCGASGATRRRPTSPAGAAPNTSLGTSYEFRAKLVGPLDTFQYYTAYNRQETDGAVSADQFKAGRRLRRQLLRGDLVVRARRGAASTA